MWSTYSSSLDAGGDIRLVQCVCVQRIDRHRQVSCSWRHSRRSAQRSIGRRVTGPSLRNSAGATRNRILKRWTLT